MPRLESTKQEGSGPEMPWADPVEKRAKADVKEENNDDEMLNMISDGSFANNYGSEELDPEFAAMIAGLVSRSDKMEKEKEKKELTLEELKAEYPPDMIEEMEETLKGWVEGRQHANSVYVVTHAAQVDVVDNADFDFVGTYSDVTAANVRVMSVFHEKYSHLLDGAVFQFNSPPDDDECLWWVDGSGLLSLWAARADEGRYRVRATKQEVGTDGLKGKSVTVHI
ncbi:hypothetical protein F4820DRAFT_298885 [Hypoxylon rubiginosum]|uniref:Uncharacterized protein n=1 Tax=Hypoxylon rubiginosum TaxID=110542 RepID=A0ACB9Z0V1_9PEZI|nr:hypothetical protein F4820DRAFT_298885 [Hypoxylon rubiginosum]